MSKSKYYWFSFAGVNKNLGVVSTEATSIEDAFRKIKALDLVPKELIVDVAAYEIPEIEIELDVFHSSEDMLKSDYKVTTTNVPVCNDCVKEQLEENLNQQKNNKDGN